MPGGRSGLGQRQRDLRRMRRCRTWRPASFELPTRATWTGIVALHPVEVGVRIRHPWCVVSSDSSLPGGRLDRRSRPENRGSERNLGAFRGGTLPPVATPAGMRTPTAAADFREFWYARRDSNARPSAPELGGRVLGCRGCSSGKSRTRADPSGRERKFGPLWGSWSTGNERNPAEASGTDGAPQTATWPSRRCTS